MSRPARVIFIRPSLGIGGAERWVLDAARALRAHGWDVEIAVNYFDPDRTLPEARTGRIKISALGGRSAWLASGRFRALTALAGQWLLVRRLRRRETAAAAMPDLFICDLVPHAAAWVRELFPRAKVLVYCHFPDGPSGRAHGWYARYRAAIARREVRGMLAADLVVANSGFTAEAVQRTFPGLDPKRLEIVYPGVALDGFGPGSTAPTSILVLARFDPAKNHELALAAFAGLRAVIAPERFARCRLILAGGFDRRLPEAQALVNRLQIRAGESGLSAQVEFHFDPSHERLGELWERAWCLLHPAPAEHFGIVLIEAMARRLPVLAVAHGGPLEIVADGLTGALCPPEPAAFAAVLGQWLADPETAAALGRAGRARAERLFSADRFAAAFAAAVERVAPNAPAPTAFRPE